MNILDRYIRYVESSRGVGEPTNTSLSVDGGCYDTLTSRSVPIQDVVDIANEYIEGLKEYLKDREGKVHWRTYPALESYTTAEGDLYFKYYCRLYVG